MNFANQQFIHTLALYGAVVVIPYFVFCKIQFDFFLPWRSNLSENKREESHEIISTLLSFLVLYALLVVSGSLQEKGILVFHNNLPNWYFWISFPLVVVIHDAYFYWGHYLMHRSKFMFKFHKKHHSSHNVTPLDVFAFHPVEAFIHFMFFVIYPLVVPTDLKVMQFMFIWMTICNSAGHLPYEFYPKFLYEFPGLKECNSATHHQMHHKYYTTNFSLYYNWWDRWMGTNHKDYFSTYKKIKEKKLTLHKKLHPTPQTFISNSL